MRLVTFSDRTAARIGLLVSHVGLEYVLDLSRTVPDGSADMIEFLRAGDPALALARQALESHDPSQLVPLESVTLLAPIPRPGKIICVGYNYRDHTTASGDPTPLPEYPNIFAKFANVVIGPAQPIVYPRIEIQLDYEGELAVVIGRRAKHVDEAHALEVVAGYTVFNDVTARDYQNRTSQWTLGKSFDTFGPMGPALTTRDEIPNPGNLDLRLFLNRREMQHANTCDLIFSIPFLIAYLTRAMTLEPGDVICTGTPAGVGSMRKPPVYMRPGDVVCVQIEKVGRLENPVIAAE